MKKIIAIILFFISAENGFGQITFVRSYEGFLNGEDVVTSMDLTYDGGYIIAGTSNYSSTSSQNFILVKTNSYGDTSWIKSFGSSNDDYAYSVTQTSDSGFVITGNSHVSGNNYHTLLIKTDVNGNTLWSKLFSVVGSNDFPFSVKQTYDGGLIVAGKSNNSIFLIKTDNNGDTLWTRSFGTGSAAYIEQTSDSGFIITGEFALGSAGDVYLVKTDVNGMPVWAKRYGNNSQDFGHEVHQTNDGGYIVCGNAGASPRIYLIKTDSNGDTLWTKNYVGPQLENGYSIRQTFDGGYIAAGMSINGFSWYIDLIKTDTAGNISWVKATEGQDQFYSVRQTSDSGYVIAAGLGGLNGWALGLIKTDVNGNAGCNQVNYSLNPYPMVTNVINSPVSLNSITTVVNIPTLIETTGGNFQTFCFSNGISENADSKLIITISPNPATNNFTITFPNTINKGSIEIYNVLGKNIFTENITNVSRKEIHLNNINAGIYFLKVRDGEKEYCEKLVIE